MSTGNKRRKKDPFREAFARVKVLRSLLPGVPMIALTASVLLQERHKVIKASGMVDPIIIDVSPNKENISLNFIEMKNESYAGSNLQWVADMVSNHTTETPHTIIFCKTFNSIAFVLSYLLMALRGKAFVTTESQSKISLIGVYHAKTWDKEKRQIEQNFKVMVLKGWSLQHVLLAWGAIFPMSDMLSSTPPLTHWLT